MSQDEKETPPIAAASHGRSDHKHTSAATAAIALTRDPAEIPVLLGVALAEALALFWAVSSASPPLLILTIHALALLALGTLLVLSLHRKYETTSALLALLATAVAGPLGTIGAAALCVADRRHHTDNPLIARWYERIALSTEVDDEERLSDDVRVGRSITIDGTTPPAFPSLMQTGSLHHRQTILGIIARRFHPAYLSTLKIALESPEPVLRVQAAAVAAHVAPEVAKTITGHMQTAKTVDLTPSDTLSLLVEIEQLIASGLLDESVRLRAVECAHNLGDDVIKKLRGRPLTFNASHDIAKTVLIETMHERILLDRALYADLRAQRSARRVLQRHPTARFRRLTVHANPTRIAS